MKIVKYILVLITIFCLIDGVWAQESRRETSSKDTQPKDEEKKQPPAAVPSKIQRRGTKTIQPTSRSRRGTTSRKVATKTSGFISTLNMKPNLDSAVLYLSPLDIRTSVGKEFVTSLSLSNRNAQTFDRFYVVLTYDPDFLMPLGFNDEALKSIMTAAPAVSVQESAGVIIYEATLRKPMKATKLKFCFIKWQALKPTVFTQIGFGSINSHTTRITNETGNDILGDPSLPDDGLLPTSVTISGMQFASEEEPLPGFSIYGTYLGGGAPELPEFDYGLHLSLIPEKNSVTQGEEFLVHIYISNPRELPSDDLDLVIHYDPSVFEVLDYDEGNWITRGINIFDGLYHDIYPFDYQIKNMVIPSEGTIYYRMASTDVDILTEPGTLATIKFRARKPHVTRAVTFMLPSNERDDTGSRISFADQDVLGSPDIINDGVTNCLINVD